MRKIYLSYKSVKLGYLCKEEKWFRFYADEENIKKLKKKCPILMKTYTLNVSGAEIYARMPDLFSKFIPSNERVDLLNKAGVVDGDDDFEKLYKLAGLNMVSINFKISK